ncbi:MAG: sigma-70 family RNA polymerase sigma factor [Bacilli bacterium]|nr:sigma-70 family RNA polymerase sigma factor [Bacilli bacterium]
MLFDYELRKEEIFDFENKEIDYDSENEESAISSNDSGGILTNSVVHDLFSKTNYIKYSLKEELDFIKKTKLSYYDEVDDNLKQLYIKYYGEVKPYFKERYEKASLEGKKTILDRAINRSLEYRDQFINNNLRLAFSIAKKYAANGELEVLWQEGILGMIEALKRFDIEKEVKFSTYATWWIKRYISEYISNDVSMIRIPVYFRKKINEFESAKIALCQKLGHIPSREEILNNLEISSSELDKILETQTLIYSRSLDETVNDQEDILVDFIPAEDSFIDVDNKFFSKEFMDIIDDIGFNDREKEILCLRYGFYNGKTHTLAEIGKKLGISTTRVGQLEKIILNKIRRNSKIIRYLNGDYSKPVTIDKKEDNKQDEFSKEIILTDIDNFNVTRDIIKNFDTSIFDADTRYILNKRYGVISNVYSSEEIARMLGITVDEVLYKENLAIILIGLSLDEDSQNNKKVRRNIKRL